MIAVCTRLPPGYQGLHSLLALGRRGEPSLMVSARQGRAEEAGKLTIVGNRVVPDFAAFGVGEEHVCTSDSALTDGVQKAINQIAAA